MNETNSNSTQKVIRTEAPPPGKLGKSELYALSIGQVIGAGIITLVGPGIAYTGQSVWLAYAVAVLYGFVMIMPLLFVTSTLRLGGGYYSLLAGLGNEKLAGMYAFAFLVQLIQMSLYGVSLGVYVNSIFPSVRPQIVGIVALTVFYVINFFGVDIMAKAQKAMTWFLLTALIVFIIIGFTRLENPVWNISAPNFFSNGFSGFKGAVFLFAYSCWGYSMTMNYGKDAKNAKKDIPWVMIVSMPTILIVYCGIAVVGSGVLPIDMVANQPLTLVARTILNPVFFTLFIIGGPIVALMTTINSSMAYYCIPIAQSCEDGWLPKSWAKTNKHGASVRILTIVYLVGLIPLIFNLNVTTITNNMLLLYSVFAFLYTVAYLKLPKKYETAWKKSKYHIPDGAYYFIVILSFLAYAAIFVNALMSLSPIISGISLGAIGICLALGLLRSKNPDIRVVTTVWDD